MPKPHRLLPSLDVLRNRFDPDFSAGVLRLKDGRVAGWDRGTGYLTVQVEGQQCLVHRILWFMATGEQPDCLDHIDRDRQNNAISNLRAASVHENSFNRTVQPKVRSGVLGVGWSKRDQKWTACIRHNGQYHYLGQYAELEAAVAARKAGECKFFQIAA